MLILTVLQGPDKGARFELPDDEPQMIGRSSESLPLTDYTISRRHCELTPDEGVWYIRDLDSANGTFLNDSPRLSKGERHALVAHREAGTADVAGQRRIERQRLDAQPRRVDNLEHQLARIDHLAGDDMRRRDHARDRRHQRLARREAGADSGDALGQALRLALGGLDVLAGHGVGQFLQARDALVGQRLRSAQFGQLRGLVRAFDRGGGRHDVGQHLALAHGLTGVGQAAASASSWRDGR